MEFLYNIPLDFLERTKQYKELKKLLEEALYKQWEDLVSTGILVEAEHTMGERYIIKSEVKKAKDQYEDLSTTTVEEKPQPEKIKLRDVAGFLIALNLLVGKRLKPIGTYNNIGDKVLDFLRFAGGKSGQGILDQISDFTNIRPKIFNLTNGILRQKLSERTITLLNEVDTTTKKMLAREIKNAMIMGGGRLATMEEVLKKGRAIAKLRADRIAETELEAVHGFIREYTAKLNGFEVKEWFTVGDDRVCSICGLNNREIRPIDESFGSGHSYPPAHIKCRCSVSFGISDKELGIDRITSYLKKSTLEVLDNLVQKQYTFYDVDKNFSKDAVKIINPEAQWVGGDSLVGKDKEVGFFVDKLEWTIETKQLVLQNMNGESQIDRDYRIIQNVLKEKGDAVFLHLRRYFPQFSEMEALLVEARVKLSDVGYLQLLSVKGYKGNVLQLKGKIKYPKLPYTDIQRKYAQDLVKRLSNVNDDINLAKLNLSVLEVPLNDKNFKEGKPKNIEVSLIDFSKEILKGRRVISIMDNFNESQRSANNGIEVYYIPETKRYIVGSDGNHRLFACKYLGYDTIYASKIFIK